MGFTSSSAPGLLVRISELSPTQQHQLSTHSLQDRDLECFTQALPATPTWAMATLARFLLSDSSELEDAELLELAESRPRATPPWMQLPREEGSRLMTAASSSFKWAGGSGTGPLIPISTRDDRLARGNPTRWILKLRPTPERRQQAEIPA